MIVYVLEHVCETGFHNVRAIYTKKEDAEAFVKKSGYCTYRWEIKPWKVIP